MINDNINSNSQKTQKLNQKYEKSVINKQNKHKKYVFTTKWKQFYIPVFISLFIIFIASILLIFLYKPPTQKDKKFDSGWQNNIVAPFIDMASWINTANEYSFGGVPNVALVEEQTGIKYYNLGFIQPDSTTPLEEDGTIRWGWGGLYKLSERGNDGYQYPKIKEQILSLEKMGAIYTISVGGQAGKSPWVVSSSVEKLEEMYLDIISTYNLKRLDLDIEESNQDESANITNAKAIKKVQDKTGIEIVLTIPIMPTGWKDKQIKIIKAYLNQGVKISLINSMTMCYGAEVNTDEDYGDASIRAIENSVKQMQEIWASYGTTLSKAQAYNKTGATVDIGYESDLYPIFTKEMTRKVVSHAKENNYGMISYWSLNRDAQMEYNKGVNLKYEFLNEMNNLYK